MNIKMNLTNLSESEQQQVNYQDISDVNFDIEKVMQNKSLQFKFDCGLFMAKIVVPLDSKFGLKWHYDNTKSLEEFIESVKSYLAAANNVLSENDISNLTKQYQIKSK